MRIWSGLLVILLAACQPFAIADDVKPTHIADKNANDAHWTRHYEGEVSLRIMVPKGWETYNTAAGIVLNEHMGSSAPGSPLRGFLIHVFVPHDQNFIMPPSSDVNMAWFILNQVVTNPDYVGQALVSEPVAFEWDQHEAAYYLLNNRDDTVTMLLALALPDHSNLVVAHISVPEDQAPRVRSLLPKLLETLTIDGQRVDAAALHNLPDPLVFPVE
jgi:hypothetical protein